MECITNIQMFNECKGKHKHEWSQILVPLKDPMTISIGNYELSVNRKELCFIPAMSEHACIYTGKILAINLSNNIIESKNTATLADPIVVSMQAQIMQLVELIQIELTNNPNSKAVNYLYDYLYSKLTENGALRSVNYIHEHYDSPITVEQLASIENYNVTYYNNWFKKKIGLCPSLYLRTVRINKAKELLKTTNFSIMEIAVMVGYGSNSTFTRAFHNVTGMSPKEYRAYNLLVDNKMQSIM